MKFKIFSILTILTLASLAPLAAQQPAEDPGVQPPAQEELAQGTDLEQPSDQPMEATATATPESDDVTGDSQDQDVDVQASVDVDADNDEELPKTASPLPLLALLGGASLASGLGLRALRRQN